MSTLRTINVIHPSGSTTNIVNDNTGNVAVGGTLTASTITSAASTALTIQSAGTTVMTVDTSQNVGIGTTSPGAKLDVNGNAYLRGTTYLGSSVAQNIAADSTTLYLRGTAVAFQDAGASSTKVYIDSSGNFLVGTTTSAGRATFSWVSESQGCLITRSTSETYAGSPVVFQNSSGGTAGFISQATSSVSYNTSSDYRMKENVAPLSGGLTTISALKPVTYDWKNIGTSGEGFIAHELAEVIPLAVFGEKDAVNEDGSIKSQGVDYSKIVVHLVAACQELSAKNDALEASNAAFERRLAALENK